MEEQDRVRLEELERENQRLRAELASWRSGWSQLGWFSRGAWRIGTAFGLGAHIRQWIQAIRSQRNIPLDETVELVAALVNRWLVGTLIGVLVALIPSIILIVQVWQFQAQNALLREQNARQSEEVNRARRVEYLQSLYDIDCETRLARTPIYTPPQIPGTPTINMPPSVEDYCRTKANGKIRAAALLAWIALERHNASEPKCEELDNHQNYIKVVDISKARLEAVDLAEADLRCVLLYEADLSGSNLRKSKLQEADLREAKLEKVDLREADLSKTDLREAKIEGSNLEGAILREAILHGAHLDRSNLREVNLSGVNLKESKLWETDLRGANLKAANLTNAHLVDANLDGADLSGADLSGANLTRAKFSSNNRNTKGIFGGEPSEAGWAKLCKTTMPDGTMNNRDCSPETQPAPPR